MSMSPKDAYEMLNGAEIENGKLRAEIERLRDFMPPHFIPPRIVREFMAHRHFWAAHEIDIVARKDGKEYRLEGDWLKDACRTLAALEPKP